MAFYPSLTGDAQEAYNKATNVIFETAQLELGMTPDKLVIRDLRAVDLGRTLAVAVANTSDWHVIGPATPGIGTLSNWVNYAIDNTKFVSVYGFALQTAVAGSVVQNFLTLEEIRVTRGGKLLRIWPVHHLSNDYGGAPRIWFADDPVTVSQNITLTIDLVFNGVLAAAAGTFDLIMLGRVVEPDSRTINKVV